MKNLYEIFDEFEAAPTRKEKIAVLQNNSRWDLSNVLTGTFDPNLKYVFKKIPEYIVSDSPPGMGYNSIHQELGRRYLFEQNHPRVSPKLTQERKEIILIQLLESLEAREAAIYAGMLMKKLPVKGLTYAIVKEAFPDILP